MPALYRESASSSRLLSQYDLPVLEGNGVAAAFGLSNQAERNFELPGGFIDLRKQLQHRSGRFWRCIDHHLTTQRRKGGLVAEGRITEAYELLGGFIFRVINS